MTVHTSHTAVGAAAPWHDRSLSPEQRVDSLVVAMTVPEKIAQLYGVWVGADTGGGDVAPHQHEMDDAVDLDALLEHGLGQLTRPFGTAPVDAGVAALSLASTQRRIVDRSRFGIPAMAHEECLAGFAAWGATAYPVPLSWGASFDPELVERMARRIGDDMRSVGIHQGLAPVLDVVRDARWGRVEETIGEDPYLVGTVGTAYVRGLESAGIVATLKHFVGYSASRAGRNLAPVSVGPRELADVLLPPFEMAVREGGARSVMNSYSDLDGVPSAADRWLLTELLREQWGFSGTVVADYFAIAFLRLLHGTADTWAEAAGAAIEAGIDVELPTVKTFGEPLRAAVEQGVVAEALIDQALRRVLLQKLELGLLDADYSPVPAALVGRDADHLEAVRGAVDLDSPANRALARELAERSVVLVRNTGVLPLAAPPRIAIIGPNADDPYAMLGCYSFPTHVVSQHEGVAMGIEIATVSEALRAEFPRADIVRERGTGVDDGELDGIAAAVDAARTADVAIVVLGDRAGLFGRGTSGEGCDAPDLSLPGAQQQLLDALLDTGTPVVVVLLTGRPYALGSAPQRAAAIVQAFFPGEEGAAAIAGVLSGRVAPTGRLPVSIPAHPGVQPSTYLAAPLARATDVSNIDPTAAYPFGHGLGYGELVWTDLESPDRETAVDGEVMLSMRLVNPSDRELTDVVQLYLHDPTASIVRPVQRLIGFQRVTVPAGSSARVAVAVPIALTSFTGRDGQRIVEPGDIVLGFGRSSADIPLTTTVVVTGEARAVGADRALHPRFQVVLGP
ncbi:beta-xylosidase/alpha-l-arabinosidase [Microcella humidisoli]|uniref:Glycoside hydrolase family 3 C-terminal domain-containing protein n=1 Tax=Microcella humidisoli TaxID=2963406 RepID=A0ABY5FZ75_9MICO|nr:glycoside hydrolase family 3 N-terminal domain-containing protein [Microcella humidisoli]UTT63631.1 glycoside hydrolase family 3 C-terminal domain-containing protein [Microcella humidisoli]